MPEDTLREGSVRSVWRREEGRKKKERGKKKRERKRERERVKKKKRKNRKTQMERKKKKKKSTPREGIETHAPVWMNYVRGC